MTKDSRTGGEGDETSPGGSLSQRIQTTPTPPGGWCAWCQDKPSAGQLVLVDDTGVPIPHPKAPPGGWHLCGWCGWRFHQSESTTLNGTYIFDPVEGA